MKKLNLIGVALYSACASMNFTMFIVCLEYHGSAWDTGVYGLCFALWTLSTILSIRKYSKE